jgi:AcrR family transcriptional regulator
VSRSKKDAPRRSDAQRNRERILHVAMVELTQRADAPLSAIARKAGVGQATFYRNFPHREALVLEIYRYEMQQVADAACELLETRPPERALREWMDRLARFAMTKAGLADAIRLVTSAPGGPARPGPTPIMEAAGTLLRTCEEAGAIRAGVTPDDFFLAIAGLWQIDPQEGWEPTAGRLLDLVMDGLRVGAPGP